MTKKIDYTRDFLAFYRDMFVVEGSYGPRPVIPPFMEAWISQAFPKPAGDPACRNIADFRTKKQGKSALAAGVALYMATRQPYSEVIIAAADKDQATDRVLRSVKYAVTHGPLRNHARVYKDVIELENESIIQAIPSDWQSAAGGNYYCVIFDELHAWTYEGQRRVFDELVIPPTQKHGCRWMASYAGFLGESELLHHWWGRALAADRINKDLPIHYNEAASFLAFVDVGEVSWRMPWMTEKYICEIKASERLNTFRRIWLNEWTTNEGRFVPEGAWEACYSPDVSPVTKQDKIRIVLGADASTSRDLTSLVGSFYNHETKTVDVCYVRTWKPTKGLLRRGKPTVDLDSTLGAAVKELHERRQIDCIVVDPFQMHTLIIEWERAGINVIELAQTSGRTEADQGLYDAIIGKKIRHYSEPTLNEHIQNAVALETVRGYRLAKEKTTLKIDAAVALSQSHYGVLETQLTPVSPLPPAAKQRSRWRSFEGESTKYREPSRLGSGWAKKY